MLNDIMLAVISLIEKELIAHAPEIEAAVMVELEKLGSFLMSYVNGKIGESEVTPSQEHSTKAIENIIKAVKSVSMGS